MPGHLDRHPHLNVGGRSELVPPEWIVLQCRQMSHTITVRLSEELAAWLAETARQTGVPAGRIVRQQLERASTERGKQRFLRHAGKISGPVDLSSRRGFALR